MILVKQFGMSKSMHIKLIHIYLIMISQDHVSRSLLHADLQLCIALALQLHGFAESLQHPSAKC